MQVELQLQQQQDLKLSVCIEEISQEWHQVEAELQHLTVVLTESKQANVVAGAKAAAAASSVAADLQAAQVMGT